MARPAALPSRRSVVIAGAVGVAAALTTSCSTPWGRLTVGAPPPPRPPDADHRALARARSTLAPLQVAARAEVGAAPGPWSEVVRLLDQQAEALASPAAPTTTTASSSAQTTPTTTGTTPASTSASGPPAAASVRSGISSAAQSTRRSLPGVSGPVARLLACLAAGDDAAAAALAQAQGTAPDPLPRLAAPTSPVGAAQARSLGAALAVEEACVYGYGVLAVRLADADRDAAKAALAAHDAAVDALRERLVAARRTPPPAAPGWQLPAPVHDAAAALTLALRLERACAAAWADLVAASAPGDRRWAAVAISRAAIRASLWRRSLGSPLLVALPGLDDRPAPTASATPTATPTATSASDGPSSR